MLTLILLAAVLSFGPVLGAVAALVIIAAAVAASWFAFANGQLVLDPILPSVSVLSVYIVATALLLLLTDRERQFVRRAFSQYLAPAMVERLAEDPAALTLGGETREITILFSDIRGFTSLSEKMDPQEITEPPEPLPDADDGRAAPVGRHDRQVYRRRHHGVLERAARHAGPPAPRLPCRARHAEGAGGAEQDARAMAIKIGVGLNTGACCVGNLGSEQRFSYSAIGDSVNVAARVEGLTKQYGLPILITENTDASRFRAWRCSRSTSCASSAAPSRSRSSRLLGDETIRAVERVPGDLCGAQPDDRDLSVGRRSTRRPTRREATRRSRRHRCTGSTMSTRSGSRRCAKIRRRSAWDGVFTAVEK